MARSANATSAPRGNLGFGITGRRRTGNELLAARVEQLGYDELWSNDTRAGSGLETLAACAGATRGMALGVGVIGLSERDGASVVNEIARLALPLDRLIVGIGSGSSSSLDLVRAGAAAIRAALPHVTLAVAALGPRMCQLAGEIADVVLLNWSLPERITWSREQVAAGARLAQRPPPRIAAYVRVAIGPHASARLRAEAERYSQGSRAYRQVFETRSTPRTEVGIATPTAARVPEALMAYREVLDTTIVRGLPARDDVDAWLEIAEAAAPSR